MQIEGMDEEPKKAAAGGAAKPLGLKR
jgi:hypothetical protein